MKTRAAVAFAAKQPLEVVEVDLDSPRAAPLSPRIVNWRTNGKIEIDPMITHVLGIKEIDRSFGLMHAGESIRGVVVY